MKKPTPYTPGPWLVDSRDVGPNGRSYSVINSENDVIVGEGFDPRLADARLIAAAPELLEALNECFVALGRMGANMSSGSNRQEWLNARAAIMKAEGLK